jgi:putative MFS transporter
LLGLIGSGLFLDSLDLYIQGPILAFLLSTQFSDIHGNAQFLSATFLGLIVGTLISGWCGDRFGRRVMYQVNLLLFGLASLLASFAPSLKILVCCRFAMGIGLGGEVIISYGALAEFLPPHARSTWQGKLAFLSNLAIPLSALVCAAILPTFGWRPVFALVGICSILAWLPRRQVPESPRWYEAQGRIEEAEHTITLIEDEIQRTTGAKLAEPRQTLSVDSDSHRTSFTELFRGRLFRRTLLAIWLMVCMNTAIYTFVAWLPTILLKRGVEMNRIFLLTVLMQIGALPGALGGTWVAERYGRPQSIAVLSIFAAASTAAYGFVNGSFQLVLSGWFAIVFLYGLVAISFGVYVPEMFPTSLRMTGTGISNACGRIANVLAPQAVAWILINFGFVWVYVGLSLVFLLLGLVVWIAGEDTGHRSLEEIA